MNTNSAFTGSYTENPFWYRQFALRQIRILGGGQSIVDFDAAENCRLYMTTMKAMNFQDHIPSIPIDKFKDHYVLVFDFISMHDATEKCHYPELIGEPLRLELNFTFPLEHVLNSLYSENECHRLQLTSLVLLEKTSKMHNVSLQQIFNRIQLLKCRYRGFFPSDFVPTLDNDTFAIRKTQPSNMQGEHWIMIANSCQRLNFAELLVVKKTVSLNSNMNRWCQNHYSPNCGFDTIYAVFHLLKLRQEEITGVHDDNVLSFIGIYI